MKLIYTFVFLVFSICTSGIAQTTVVSDANFEQELIALGIDTNGANGNILNTDAQAVTSLNLSGATNIVDITGIDAFVNLIDLNLGNNQIANFQLTALTQLVNFTSNNNDALALADFSQNTLLETVYIESQISNSVFPPITVLDFSQNLNLVKLNIHHLSNLTDLILPVANTLTSVETRSLADADLDFSLLAGLQNVTVRSSVANNTQITLPNEANVLENVHFSSIDFNTPIDLSKYINLVRVDLFSTEPEELILPTTNTFKSLIVWGHNFLTPFSLASVPEVEYVDIRGFSNTIPLVIDLLSNPKIKTLWLTGNEMTSVDLTNITDLHTLYIYDNELTVLDLTQNIDLQTLDASRNLLPSIDLAQNIDLQFLTLSSNQLPTIDVTQNINLSSINISHNLFTGSGLDLTQNTSLSSINISNNQVETLDITQNVNLWSFNLSFNLFPGNDILSQFATIVTNRGRLGGQLIANNNMLFGPIPDFYGLYDPTIQTRRFELYINENRFHFGDFESQHLGLVDLTTTMSIGPSPDVVIRNYWYAPQAKVNAIENFTRNAGDDITLTTTVRGAQNHYVWFKDGAPIPGAPDAPAYTIIGINTCDEGVYHCEITSDLVPFENGNPPGTNGKNLLLIRNDITLNVNSPAESCTSLTSPTNGSVNVALNEVLTWTESLGACGYYLNVGTTSGGTDILNNVQVEDANTYILPSNLPANTQVYVTITPYFSSGNVLTCTEETFTTGTNTNPILCTALNAPLDGSTDVSVDANISWHVSAGATGYYITIGTTSGGTDIANNEDVGNTTTYNPTADFSEGDTIYVLIVPYDGSGNATGCVEESFVVESLLPSCSNLSTPLNGATNVSVSSNISWNAVGNATGYFISIGTTSGGTEITNTEDVGNTTTYNPAADLPADTEIFVTITPYNSAGNASGCSEEHFRTEVITPVCTNLSAPSNGATNVLISSNISWNTVSNATGYFISIGTTSGGTEITNTEDVGNATTYNPAADLPADTEIFVKITPYNSAGNASGCSEERFRTEVITPVCTNLSSPLNGATNVLISSNISWNAIGNTTGYLISIGTTSGGIDIANAEDVGNTTTYNPAADLPDDTEIFVTVTPYNTAGNAAGCSEESFRTEVVTPVCTTLNSPLNGTTNVSISSNITWNAIGNATGYFISIGTTSGGTDITNAEDVGNTTTYNPVADLPADTEIFVTITPYNTAGNASGCSEERFRTEIVTPVCTNLRTPSNGATNVLISSNISWNAVRNTTGYLISIGTTSGGTDIANAEDVGNTTTYNPAADLPDDTEIFVTIAPYNTAGNAIGCSEERFRTEIIIPVCTRLISPINGATNIALDASISWNPIPNATGYLISMGTSSGASDIVNSFDVGNTTTFTPLEDFPDETEIFVTIIPYNTAGNANACQEERFTTEVVVPICANLVLPSNGAIDVPVDTNITWDFITNADGYKISIGTSSGNSDILNDLDVGLINSYNPSSDFPDGIDVYVQITPYNSAGDAIGCEEFSFKLENRSVFVPQFFTPNNDGYNDIWKVTDPKNEIKRIYIYDRYGKLIKTIADTSIGWNGYVSGLLLPTNDYWCVIEFFDRAPLRKHFTLKR